MGKAVRPLLPRGEKGRDEGARAAFSGKDPETPPALFLQLRTPTLTPPSPLEGEGLAFPIEGEGEREIV
jgi:hypothetical protein